jgi:hypothetical protein
METQLDIASSLMSPPKRDNMSMWKAQLGFMNMFAIPLFEGVAKIMPSMQYCVEELNVNKALFESSVAEEQARQGQERPGQVVDLRGGDDLSPRTTGPLVGFAPVEAVSPLDSKGGVCLAGEGPTPDEGSGSVLAYRDFSPEATSPTSKPPHIPALAEGYKEVNGASTQFETVAAFAASDPFNISEARQFTSGKQRCSEATEGSASAPGAGDWASQATSATTSKMPLSPSTQGTSIVSRDSMDRPSSVPVTNITAPDSSKSQSEPHFESHSPVEDESSLSSNGKSPDGKAVKKKSSRFLNIFRRNRGATPPCPPLPTGERQEDSSTRFSRVHP